MTQHLLGLGQLRKHKFNHNFQSCINPLCSCGMDFKQIFKFSLHYPLFDEKRIIRLSTLSKTNFRLIETSESLTETILFLGIHCLIFKKTPYP